MREFDGLNIAGVRYKVRFVNGLLIDPDGKEQLVLANFDRRKIQVSLELSPGMRFVAIMQVFHTAWEHHAGPAAAHEADERFSDMVAQMIEDVWGEGAPVEAEALMGDPTTQRVKRDDGRRVVPLGLVDASEATSLGVIEYDGEVDGKAFYCAQCAKCEALIGDGAIVNEPPTLERFGMWNMRRTLYCDGCRHLQSWFEACTREGKPTSNVLTPPEFTQGEAVEQFLIAHPRAANVIPG